MSREHDITNERFGRLMVLCRDPNSKLGRPRWFCECDCGAIKSVRSDNLVSGRTRSCTCLMRECARIKVAKLCHFVHGCAGRNQRASEYRAWQKARENYPDLIPSTFLQFYRVMGPKPESPVTRLTKTPDGFAWLPAKQLKAVCLEETL